MLRERNEIKKKIVLIGFILLLPLIPLRNPSYAPLFIPHLALIVYLSPNSLVILRRRWFVLFSLFIIGVSFLRESILKENSLSEVSIQSFYEPLYMILRGGVLIVWTRLLSRALTPDELSQILSKLGLRELGRYLESSLKLLPNMEKTARKVFNDSFKKDGYNLKSARKFIKMMMRETLKLAVEEENEGADTHGQDKER